MIRFIAYCLFTLFAVFFFRLESKAQPADTLQNIAEQIVKEEDLVALAVGIYQWDADGTLKIHKGAAGLRQSNKETEVSLTDLWHIGSCTKAMTALLYGDVATQKGLSWEASLADIFKGHVDVIDPAWDNITMVDVLSHRAGIKDIGAGWILKRVFDERPVSEQRLTTIVDLLGEPPRGEGRDFNYANLNYILAGAAIEVLSGQSWEEAMKAGLPGQIMGEAGWGFGPPQGAQPEGHRKAFFRKKLKPVGQNWEGADNPAALGPAGTVHAELDVWAKFALAFLPQETSIPEALKSKLLTSPEGADYALGWGISESKNHGTIYSHAGSNTMWLAQIIIVPDSQAVVIAATNTPPDRADAAIKKASRLAMESLE